MADLLRLAFEDGTSGYAYSDDDVRDAAAGSWEHANADVGTDIQWTVDDHEDLDDLEPEMISVDARTLAELLRLARVGAEYAGCSVCRRVTLV